MTCFVGRYEQTPDMQISEDLGLLKSIIDESLQDSKGSLTTPEALFFCQALFVPTSKPAIEKSIRDLIKKGCMAAMENEKIHLKWELDQGAMQKKLDSLTMCQALAIWHNVRQFWVNPDWDHERVAELFSTSDALQQ